VCSAPGSEQRAETIKGPRFYRRGEGGEGRERGQDRITRGLFLFVQVFTGYAASLSKKLLDKNDL